MRRIDLEITDFSEIVSILHRTDTIRLGLHNEPYPYVIPMSFGFEVVGENINIYIHGAKEGLRYNLIQNNPLVCVEADIFHGYAEIPGGATAEYESFIGYGNLVRLNEDDIVKGLNLLLLHCGYDGLMFNRSALDSIHVYKIELDSFSGKRQLVT